MRAFRINCLLALSSLLFIAGGCTATASNEATNQQQDTSTKVLRLAKNKVCKYGFISPPGVKKCLKIDDIVAGNINMKAPRGRCPKEWSRLREKSFCVPENRIVSCSANDFRCGPKRSDTVRIERGLPKCKSGDILVAFDFPQFNPRGTIIVEATTCLTCGPVERIPPVQLD